MVLLLLLDAFRANYLPRSSYLRQLAREGGLGTLREPFGFVPRAAYLGGLTPGEYGYTNMFRCDPENSPFLMAHGLKDVDGLRREQFLRERIVDNAKGLLPSFAASYVSTLQIPIPWLPYFDLAERHAPDDKRKGYRSLYDLLREQGEKWYELIWPLSFAYPEHGDEALTERALREIGPEHRLAFVHLTELDGMGHAYGPESIEIQRGICRTDALARRLVEHCRKIDPQCEVILFADHGMLTVNRTIDLWARLRELPFRFGHDYVYFLDSSMARFWFHRTEAREAVERVLRSQPHGHIVEDEAEIERFAIRGCDPRNGELIFLLDPSVAVHPNFFQRDGAPPAGMHGYDPAEPDNEGVFICHGPGTPAGSAFGPVDATQIYPLLLDRLGLSPGDHTSVSLPMPQPDAASPFTKSRLPGADEMVRRDLKTICAAILQETPDVDGILLGGSFGRGEGGVALVDGRLRAVNDYDIFVATRQPRSGLELGKRLAREIGIDYVDVHYAPLRAEDFHPTQSRFDQRYGTQVLHGPASLLDDLPPMGAADIPLEEGHLIVFNRMAGFLTVPFEAAAAGVFPQDGRYLQNQVNKLLMALGDAWLLKWKAYDVSYEVRSRRFFYMGRAASLPEELLEAVRDAYLWKLEPVYLPVREAWAEGGKAPRLALRSMALLLEGSTARLLPEAMNGLGFLHPQPERDKGDRERLAAGAPGPLWQAYLAQTPEGDARRAFYFTSLRLFLAFAAGADQTGPLGEPADALWQAAFSEEEPFWPSWNRLRAETIAAWETMGH
ncbi:MAG: alkaline phosphatase family protein [Verrucomicrobium sp.]|nr:alkaline phosphatase family protein [Verrucomicrobium sp.]